MQLSSLSREIVAFFREFLPLGPKSMCVAVSGGADSMALFHLLYSLRGELGIARLGIAHVNHGLRGEESNADAAFVEAEAKRACVPVHVTTLKPMQKKSGIELWAREARYEFFARLRQTEGFDFVATGHTSDDQAETVLMRIRRGCGLKGLCAITPLRKDGVIRPLLYIKRNDLRAWLADRGLSYREDSSNFSVDFTRNLLRLETLPLLEARHPGSAAMLSRIAREAFHAWHALLPLLNTWIEENVIENTSQGFSIKKSGIYEDGIAEEAIAQVLRTRGIGFRQFHMELMMANTARTTGAFLLSGGWGYRWEKDCLRFSDDFLTFKRLESPPPSEPRQCSIALPGITEACDGSILFSVERHSVACKTFQPFSSDNMTIFLDEEKVKNSLVFRSIRRDDMFWPLGSACLRNLKEYLKKQKKLKTVIGVVAAEGPEVLWIPGVQISQSVAMTAQSRMIFKISCKIMR
jgi:tRNA(Ile)-lysidine synthase